MATATEGSAVEEIQFPPVACLEKLEVAFIMAIETVVVPVVTAVCHGESLCSSARTIRFSASNLSTTGLFCS
jgi:hypothetical protein